MNNLYVIEKLGFLNWLFQICPYLLKVREKKVYYIDASPLVIKLVQFFGRFFHQRFEKLDFRVVEIRDESGLLLRIRISYQDLLEVRKEILEDPIFEKLYAFKKDDRWPAYIEKSIQTFELTTKHTLLSRAFMLIQVALWQSKKEKQSNSVTLFLNRRPWRKILINYGKKHGVGVVFVWSGISFDVRHLPWRWLKRAYYYFLNLRWCFQHKCFRPLVKKIVNPAIENTKIAVEYYGQFNLDNPACYSDFFAWQQSELSAGDLLAFFRVAGDPLDEKKQSLLQAKGINAVVLDPRATVLRQAPPYIPKLKGFKPFQAMTGLRYLPVKGLERKWIKEIGFQYDWSYHYWKEVFKDHQAKIYLSWYKYDASHCPLGAAIRDVGGVLAIYQRALDLTPYAETELHSDLYFASSPWVAEVERKAQSKIPYFVVTGYLGDHRIPLLKEEARKVREQICKSGAKYIFAFTDENSGDDSRWHTGHEFMRVNYAFLLEKLLQNPWMGLVLKPKFPKTLRRRLNEVKPLLEEALMTGRCFLYEEGTSQGSYPPAVAALSADIAIHGHLCAPTAALEAALTGTPTLLLDREGWHVSPLYQLGEGKVVFKDWDSLWDACLTHRQAVLSQNHSIGSWAPLLDQLDAFRDGKAAYRMGTYLKWLIEGFKKGEPREAVLAGAAKRYQKIWGKDKVISIQ